MLLFAHLGLTLAAARNLRRFYDLNLFFVIVGSILPDIIDKPLGWAVYGTPAMGRIYAHTLLFLLILSAISIVLRSGRMGSLSCGVLSHLILDSMWASPVTLLWPLLGQFPLEVDLGPMGYLDKLMMSVLNPVMMVPELLGFAYILYYAYAMKDTIRAFKRSSISTMMTILY